MEALGYLPDLSPCSSASEDITSFRAVSSSRRAPPPLPTELTSTQLSGVSSFLPPPAQSQSPDASCGVSDSRRKTPPVPLPKPATEASLVAPKPCSAPSVPPKPSTATVSPSKTNESPELPPKPVLPPVPPKPFVPKKPDILDFSKQSAEPPAPGCPPMKLVMEELSKEVTGKSLKTSEQRSVVIPENTAPPAVSPGHTTDGVTINMEGPKVETKFPNSFVASKKKSPRGLPQQSPSSAFHQVKVPKKSHHSPQASIASNVSSDTSCSGLSSSFSSAFRQEESDSQEVKDSPGEGCHHDGEEEEEEVDPAVPAPMPQLAYIRANQRQRLYGRSSGSSGSSGSGSGQSLRSANIPISTPLLLHTPLPDTSGARHFPLFHHTSGLTGHSKPSQLSLRQTNPLQQQQLQPSPLGLPSPSSSVSSGASSSKDQAVMPLLLHHHNQHQHQHQQRQQQQDDVESQGSVEQEVPDYNAVGESTCENCALGKCQTVYLHMPELPFGWEKVEDPHYGVYYIDHVNRRTQYENPVHTAKKQAGEDVTNTFPRQKKPSEGGAKRSASENNMNGQLYGPGRPFFTKHPEELNGEFTRAALVKSVRGLGFTIVGGNNRDTQFLQIKNVVENGPAYLSGKLRTGDVIVKVNHTCVLGYTHQDVVRLFQSIAPGETVQLETCRGYSLPFDPDDPNTEIVTTVAVTLPQDTGTNNTPTSSANMDSHHHHHHPHNQQHNYNGNNRPGLKPLPDLARSVGNNGNILGHHHHNNGLNSTSSLSPSNSQEENSMMISSQDGANIPDLVSLSISSSRPPEVFTIPIVKGPMGFGFTIADSPYGQRVKQILDQGRCKNLAEGDLLLQINNISVRDLPHQQTVLVLKECQQDLDTVIVVQRGGIPPPGKTKKGMKMSRSFDDRQQQGDGSGQMSPGAYFFDNEDQIGNDPDDVDGSKVRSKTPLHDPSRPQRPKTPVDGMGSPRTNNNNNKFSGSSNNSNNLGRPPLGRPDFFPRYRDPRDPFTRSYSSSQSHSGGEDRWGRENAKPGQFRSRTPGPEMMTRGGPGPDYVGGGGSRPEMHRPKTPTAADMRASNGRAGFGGGMDFRGGPPSGRFTPNPSSEQGRQYRHPYQDFGRAGSNWPGDFPDQYPPSRPRWDPYGDGPALNRSYTGDLARFPHSSSLGGGRPLGMRQSTSFESDQPAPSSITRVPRRPPPQPSSILTTGRLQPQPDGSVIHEEEGGRVVEMDVTLYRQESGYGFRIIGGTEEGSQVSVGHIVPGGAADMDGRLRQFDEITHVDGNSVLNASHHRVVQLMTNAALNGRVTLSVRRVLGPEADSLSSIPQYPYDVVVSRRENEGFGFVIISSVNKPGARVDEFIGHIQENSPAARCGRLHVGDRILAVNGVDTSGMHHKDVVGLIKDSGFSVALTVGPPPDDSSSSNSQKSSQGSSMNSPGYPADRPDMNINSWERNQPGFQRPRINSSQGSDDGTTGELYQVELYRGSRGFGFSIRGGREFNAMPLFVLRIAEGGAAHLDGRLAVGDQILEINNISTERMTHTEAIEIIQSGGPSVRLLMRRTNKPPPIFEGPPASPTGMSPGSLFPPNIPPSSSTSNGPISHSSPHMGRRQLPAQHPHHHHQQLPPPPPDLQLQDDDYYNYPPPPPVPVAHSSQPQQPQVRFNTNY